mgnify:CR=1 FL=1
MKEVNYPGFSRDIDFRVHQHTIVGHQTAHPVNIEMSVAGIANHSVGLEDLKKAVSVDAQIEVVPCILKVSLSVDLFCPDELHSMANVNSHRYLSGNG